MNVLAVNDQENLAHSLQAAAASKPLNAGLKGLHAKTPGNKAPKTPFKVPLNDENAPFRAGKSVLQTKSKGNENLLMTSKKGGKVDENAFVTPAGPRARAPLGMKTTNAKANALQTPAPLSGSAKTQKASPRMRRPKVKIHQPEVQEEQHDVPEIEYMPPKEVPLPDELEEYKDFEMPKFEGNSFTRGWVSAYSNPVEDDGRTRFEREDDEYLERARKQRDEQHDKMWAKMMADEDPKVRTALGLEPPEEEAPKQDPPKKLAARQMPTIKAKSAAAALSQPPKPSYAAPTAAAKAREPTKLASRLIPGKKATTLEMNPSTVRHAAATAASRSGIGYAKSRPTTRKPLANVTRPPSAGATARRPTTASSTHARVPSTASASTTSKSGRVFSRSSSTSTQATLVAPAQEQHQTAEDIERELAFMVLANQENDEEDEAWMNSFNNQPNVDLTGEDLDGFQLQLPEGL